MSKKTINIGYARVSTHKQDLGLKVQIEALKHCDKLFIEKESGANNIRPELTKALKLASDFSKDGKQVLKILQDMSRQKGATVIIVTHNGALAPIADRVIHMHDASVKDVVINQHPQDIDSLEY